MRGSVIFALLLASLGCASTGDSEGKRVQEGRAEESEVKAPESEAPAPQAETPQPAPTEPESSPDSDRKSRLLKLLEYDPEDPLGNLEEADRLAGDLPPLRLSDGSPCVMQGAPVRLFADPLRVALTAAGDAFVAAAYERTKGGEQVRLVEVPRKGMPNPLKAFDLPAAHPGKRVAPPAIAARNDNQVSVAMVDGRGALLVSEVLLGKARVPSELRTIAERLDSRFAPALAHAKGGTIVAYTVGSTPMKVMVARVPASQQPASLTDVTPVGHGAAAPAFVHGQNPPALIALDPRAGSSNLVRVPFDEEGVPRVGKVVGSVGMTATPSQLAAASNGTRTQVGYMAMGSAATSAVGIVDLDPVTAPTALVKGTAYGPLYLSALTLPAGALFATDAPQQPGKDPTHDIVLTLNRGEAVPVAGTLQAGPSGASGAALAVRADGTVGLAYTTAEGSYLALMRCE